MVFRLVVHGALAGLLLFVGAPSGLPQSSAPDTQQQVEQHMRLVQKYLAENQPALAIPEYRAILELTPDDVGVHANLGVLLFFQGNYAEANSQLRTALKTKPDLWRIQAILGMSEKRSGDVAQSRTDMESAFAHLDDVKIRIQIGMELIESYYSTSDLDKAASVVGVMRGLQPENPEVLYAAYRIYSELTNETMLNMALVAPKSAQMHLIMAHQMALQNDNSGAIEQYREALKLNPHIPGSHFELAEALNTSLDPANQAAAEAEYKAALEENHFDEKADSRLGDIALKHGDEKQASAYYSQALALQPNDAEANIGLAKTLVSMGEKDKAVSALERAIGADPTNSLAHYRLSLLYRQMGKPDEARRELEKFQKYKALREQLAKVFVEMRVQVAQSMAAGATEEPAK